MKDFEKLPSKQLEKFSNIFMQLGLVFVLFIVYITLEHETVKKSLSIVDVSSDNPTYIQQDQDVIVVKEKKLQPKQEILKQDPFIPEELVKGDNSIVENIPSYKEEPIEILDINSFEEITFKEPIDEDVPFVNIEDAPIFKGCEGLSKKQNKICFEEKMKKFVQRNFNGGLASELGLEAGKYKIHAQFIINKQGEVVDIKIRAPHIKLKKETQKLINKLPRFTPGKQRKRPVKVRYILPISFKVD